MNKAFTNFTWRNEPRIDTPLNESNLNKINNGLNTVDDRVVAMDTSKANQSDLLKDIKTVTYNSTTGVWKFTHQNGTVDTFDQNIEKIPVSFSMSPDGIITMTTADGTTYTADIAALINIFYVFRSTNTIAFTTTIQPDGTKVVTANIVPGSITDSMIQPHYLADITVQAQSAQASANSALVSANNANADALLSQSFAVGTSGVRPGEATDNSKYYKEQAGLSASDAAQSKTDAQDAYTDTLQKYNETVVLKEATEELFEGAESTVNSIIQDAFDSVLPQVNVDLEDGHLYYQGGGFDFEVDQNPSSNTLGHLLWEVSVQ